MGEPEDLPCNGVNIVIKNPAGKILLVRHNYGDFKWSLPGGGIKKKELSNRAIYRELHEETKLTIVGRPILVADIQLVIKWRHKVLLFTAPEWGGKPEADGIEISAVEFMDTDYIQNHPDVYPAQKKFIQIFEASYLKLPLPVYALASDPPIIEW